MRGIQYKIGASSISVWIRNQMVNAGWGTHKQIRERNPKAVRVSSQLIHRVHNYNYCSFSRQFFRQLTPGQFDRTWTRVFSLHLFEANVLPVQSEVARALCEVSRQRSRGAKFFVRSVSKSPMALVNYKRAQSFWEDECQSVWDSEINGHLRRLLSVIKGGNCSFWEN